MTSETDHPSRGDLQRYQDEIRALGDRVARLGELWMGAPPTCYDAPTARRLLGNISHDTLWQEVLLGHLERVPGTRRCLITRESLEAWPETKRRAAAGLAPLR